LPGDQHSRSRGLSRKIGKRRNGWNQRYSHLIRDPRTAVGLVQHFDCISSEARNVCLLDCRRKNIGETCGGLLRGRFSRSREIRWGRYISHRRSTFLRPSGVARSYGSSRCGSRCRARSRGGRNRHSRSKSCAYASADARLSQIPHALSIRGPRGNRPGKRDSVAFARRVQVRRRLRQLKRWRQRRANRSAPACPYQCS